MEGGTAQSAWSSLRGGMESQAEGTKGCTTAAAAAAAAAAATTTTATRTTTTTEATRTAATTTTVKICHYILSCAIAYTANLACPREVISDGMYLDSKHIICEGAIHVCCYKGG